MIFPVGCHHYRGCGVDAELPYLDSMIQRRGMTEIGQRGFYIEMKSN